MGSAAALPADPQLVVDAFRYFDKVMRAHQLYLANNPAYVRSLDAARAGFRVLFGQVDAVELAVTETALLWHGVVVHEMPQIAGDSLPWLLYKEGVRELALYRGFEGAELIGLLRCLAAARRATAEQDDLLTLMWEQDFEFVRYEYIETFDQTPPLVPGEEPGIWGIRRRRAGGARTRTPRPSPVYHDSGGRSGGRTVRVAPRGNGVPALRGDA